MATNLDLDPDLVEGALALSGAATQKAALQEFIARREQRGILEWRARVRPGLRLQARALAGWSPGAAASSRSDQKLAFGVEPSRRLHRLRLARYPAQVRALDRHLGDDPRVLDAGCGKGRTPLYWSRFGKSSPVFTGIDLSRPRLSRAASRGYALLIRADLRARWPVARESFDAVILEQVLEHLDDAGVGHALDEAVRTLRPDGVIVVGVPIFTPARRALRPLWSSVHRALRRRRGRVAETHLQHFVLSELRALVEGRGFRIEEIFGVRLFTLPRNWLEDSSLWHRFHGWLGRHVPGLCSEVTVVARRSAPTPPPYSHRR